MNRVARAIVLLGLKTFKAMIGVTAPRKGARASTLEPKDMSESNRFAGLTFSDAVANVKVTRAEMLAAFDAAALTLNHCAATIEGDAGAVVVALAMAIQDARYELTMRMHVESSSNKTDPSPVALYGDAAKHRAEAQYKVTP